MRAARLTAPVRIDRRYVTVKDSFQPVVALAASQRSECATQRTRQTTATGESDSHRNLSEDFEPCIVHVVPNAVVIQRDRQLHSHGAGLSQTLIDSQRLNVAVEVLIYGFIVERDLISFVGHLTRASYDPAEYSAVFRVQGDHRDPSQC